MSYLFRGMKVPDELIESIRLYVEHGVPQGDFLAAVIDNDLREACARADERNLPILPAIVAYFYNHCPSNCWGKPGTHRRWVKEHFSRVESVSK